MTLGVPIFEEWKDWWGARSNHRAGAETEDPRAEPGAGGF